MLYQRYYGTSTPENPTIDDILSKIRKSSTYKQLLTQLTKE